VSAQKPSKMRVLAMKVSPNQSAPCMNIHLNSADSEIVNIGDILKLIPAYDDVRTGWGVDDRPNGPSLCHT